MRTTEEGIALIKQFEGLELVAYRDQTGIWTIGYGSTREVAPGMVITEEEAEARLAADLARTEALLLRCIPEEIVNRNQFSALVSFCYNVGFGELGVKGGFLVRKAGGPSTMLRCLLSRDYNGAAAEFPRWNRVGGTPSDGITRRREAEQALFLKPDGTDLA